tara:strand:- start:786 stop:1151 length:366 start_codon:yes stop_codon:yes gene_type:complete
MNDLEDLCREMIIEISSVRTSMRLKLGNITIFNKINEYLEWVKTMEDFACLKTSKSGMVLVTALESTDKYDSDINLYMPRGLRIYPTVEENELGINECVHIIYDKNVDRRLLTIKQQKNRI